MRRLKVIKMGYSTTKNNVNLNFDSVSCYLCGSEQISSAFVLLAKLFLFLFDLLSDRGKSNQARYA